MSSFNAANALEAILVKASSDPSACPAFYRALTEHELFVVIEGPVPAPVGPAALEDTKVSVREIIVDAKPHVPVFTSTERISSAVPGQFRFVALNGRELLTMLRGSDLFVNPGSSCGKILTSAEVEQILDGSLFDRGTKQSIGAGEKVWLGQPREYPYHITQALSRLFSRTREVQAAYLAHFSMPERGETPHTLIGIETSGDWRRLSEDAGVVLREVARPTDGPVDLIALGSEQTEIAKYMRVYTKPFYKRKHFGFP